MLESTIGTTHSGNVQLTNAARPETPSKHDLCSRRFGPSFFDALLERKGLPGAPRLAADRALLPARGVVEPHPLFLGAARMPSVPTDLAVEEALLLLEVRPPDDPGWGTVARAREMLS